MKDQIYHTVICLLKYNICSKDYDELLMNIDQDNVPKKLIILLVRQKKVQVGATLPHLTCLPPAFLSGRGRLKRRARCDVYSFLGD